MVTPCTHMDSEPIMDAEVWSKFPPDLFSAVLSYLSVPTLYRFRTVSKPWKALIRSPHFTHLHKKNSTGRHTYILGRMADSRGRGLPRDFCDTIGWRLLEMEASSSRSRWYTINNTLGVERIRHGKRRRTWYFIPGTNTTSKHVRPDRFEHCTQATDASLMCAFYMYPYVRGADGNTVIHNPIAREFETLSASPYEYSWRVLAVTNLVVDEANEEFKVFSMRFELDESRSTPCLILYDSVTDKWHPSSTNLARQINFGNIPTRLQMRCTLFSKGYLYVVITTIDDGAWEEWQFWMIWRYSPTEDRWTDTGAVSDDTSPTILLHPQLIESDHQIFLAAWVMTPGSNKRYEIVEIFPTPRETRLAPVPTFQKIEPDMQDLFKTTFHAESEVHVGSDGSCVHSPEVAAFGMGKSIGLMARVSGVWFKLDIESKTFAVWKVAAAPCDDELWFGQPTDLVLRPRFFDRLRARRSARQVVIDLGDDSK